MDKNLRNYYRIYIILFVVLNILNTFVVTTHQLNNYIVPFDYSFLGVLNSLLGNFVVITLFMLIFSLIIKKPKGRVIAILVATILLNLILFWSNIFNKYYGTSFSIRTLSMFKNPPEGFGLSIAFEAVKELITYYRIILFIPTFVILYLAIKLLRSNINRINFKLPNVKNLLSKFLLIVMLSILNLSVFTRSVGNDTIIDSAMPTYASQNIGIYQFYFLEMLGFDYTEYSTKNNIDEVKTTLDAFNKNKIEYKNIIDNKNYHFQTKKGDVSNISGKLIDNLNDNDNLTGVLEDYSLVLIHLESFNSFLLKAPETRAQLPNLLGLLEQSYVFNNFYTNVGIGNSFDAEIAVLTGLNANGTSTLAWDYKDDVLSNKFEFETIPKLFNQAGYVTSSMHGNTNKFYNRGVVHPNMFGFDDLYFREEFIRDSGFAEDEVSQALEAIGNSVNHHAGAWVSDRMVFKRLNEQIKDKTSRAEKFMTFTISVLPHTPYLFDPYHDNTNLTNIYDEAFLEDFEAVTIRYINYLKHYDEMFRILFEDVNGYGDDYVFAEDNLYDHKKVAYLFYGDHGSGLSNGDISKILDVELTPLEERKELLQTLAFLYVPGEDLTSSNFREGLIKGEQDLVRGQTDLFRTMIDLFNLEIDSSDYVFGVHGMSNEPTYSIDNRTGDVVTDDVFFSLRNSYFEVINQGIDPSVVEALKGEVIKFKLANDRAINNNLYKVFKGESTKLIFMNNKSYRTK